MKTVLIGFLCLCFALVIFFGEKHWNNNLAKASAEGKLYDQQLKSEENKQNKEINEAIKRTWLGKVNPRVYVLGSSVAIGAGASDYLKTSWAGLLNQAFLKTNPDVNFSNLGVGGYSTKKVLDNNILGKIINPDVVIFETCLLNNYTVYTVSQSESQIKQIYDTIHNKYPKARIVLMPSEPSANVDKSMDSEKHSYRQYVSIIGDYIKSQGWDYIDFWNDYESKVKSTGNTLKSVLTDGVHPNDTGYKIWFDSIKSHFGITNY